MGDLSQDRPAHPSPDARAVGTAQRRRVGPIPAGPARDGGPVSHHRISADSRSAVASGPSTASDLDNREPALSPPPGDEQPIIDTANLGGADSDATGDRHYPADADHATMPSDTAAAVAYWYRRDPDLHPQPSPPGSVSPNAPYAGTGRPPHRQPSTGTQPSAGSARRHLTTLPGP
jgi:hypothetical protein